MTNKTKGIIWYLAQCITVPITICFVRLASVGQELLTVIFFQNLLSLLIMAAWFVYKGISIKTTKTKLHIVRNIFGLGSWVCFFYAVNNMPLNAATAITFTGPLIGTILAAILLKEKLHGHRIIGLIVGFVGMLVLLHPDAGALNKYGLLAFLGVVLICITMIFFQILNRTEKEIVIVFYMAFYSMLMTAPFAAYIGAFPTPQSWLWIFLIATFAIFNVHALVKALKYAGIGTLMPFDFTRLIITAILAYVVFNEKLDALTAIGATIILSSAIYVVRQERKI